jgi:hypothetical protein
MEHVTHRAVSGALCTGIQERLVCVVSCVDREVMTDTPPVPRRTFHSSTTSHAMHRRLSRVIDSPDVLVAGVPHLLGFEPDESLIVLALRAVPQSPVLATLRVDLPVMDDGADRTEFVAWLRNPLSTAANMCDAMLVAVWSRSKSQHKTTLIGEVADLMVSLRVPVVDGLLVDPPDRHTGRCAITWRSVWCPGSQCCPDVIHEVGALHHRAAARLFSTGTTVPADSRHDLEAELTADDIRTQECVQPAVIPGEAREVAIIHTVSVLRGHVPITPHDVELVAQAVSTVRVRDTVLWELLARCDTDLDRVAEILADMVRTTSETFAAPLATCLAIIRWQLGDGARAMIALDRALAADPEYSLAILVGGCITHGVHPAAWREDLRRLERRHLAGP